MVRSSGIELAMALIVAPFMPFERFLPRKLDAVVKLFADLPIIKQLMEIRIRGIKIPINEIIIIYLNLIKGYKNTIFIIHMKESYNSVPKVPKVWSA